jgi:ubiquinone/menaquinone biosynthesis C-methylase UbiE
MNLWSSIFAAGYDHFMAGTERAGLSDIRDELLKTAAGRVLEIGGGTGANLPFYRSDVSELIVSEPEEPMAYRLEKRLAAHALPARVIRAPAEQLPLDSATFDRVVSTLVLCTVTDPAQSLRELRRVLKPDGQILFIEHVRAEDPKLARWQDRLRRPWAWFGNGCQCNRPIVEMMQEAGFDVRGLSRGALPKAPPIVRPLVFGAAGLRR